MNVHKNIDLKNISTFWKWLITPQIYTSEENLNRSRLLLLVWIGLFVLLVIMSIVVNIIPTLITKDVYQSTFVFAAMLIVVIAYWIAWKGFVFLSAWIGILFSLVASTISTWYIHDLNQAIYFMLGILVSGIFLSPKSTLFLSLLVVVINIFLYFYLGEPEIYVQTLFANSVMSLCIGIFLAITASIRDKYERYIRQQNQLLMNISIELKQRAETLEHQKNMMDTMTTMNRSLQACDSPDLARQIIFEAGQSLFPGCSGAIYLRSAANLYFERDSQWGEGEYEDKLPVDYKLKCVKNKKSGVCVPFISENEQKAILCFDNLPSTVDKAFVITFADLSILALFNINLRESLKNQAIRDALTNLYNRRFFDETLMRDIKRAERNHHQLGLVIMDIDHFKYLNDTYGHDVGDFVLCEVSNLMKLSFRASDYIFRFGGDEFIILLPDIFAPKIIEAVERFLQKLREIDFVYQNLVLRKITISAGVAIYPSNGSTGADIFQAADEALYIAKQNGRNHVVLKT
jgi:diguanylate cyclase (GGDEF)-like protein